VAAITKPLSLMYRKAARLRGFSVSVWLAFFLFCLLSSAGWLIPPGVSDEVPGVEREGLLFGVVGVLFGLKGVRWRGLDWRLVMGGVGFFGVPVVFFEWAAGSLSGVSRSVGFAMVPLVVVLVVASTGGAVRRLLAPCLVGLSGVLFLLPVELPEAARGRWMLVGLVLVVVLVAVLSVGMNRLLQSVAWREAVAVVCLSNGVFLLVCCAAAGSFVWRWSALASVVSVGSLLDLVEVVLLLWLLREMAPVRLAARYRVIPLLTVVEGYLVLRPELTARMGFGFVLLAVGAGVVLFSKEFSDEVVLSLR
jgi:drug/metabolite transporter (DMT)-like permease